MSALRVAARGRQGARGGPYLPARDPLLGVDGRPGPRRIGQGGPHRDGELWHRHRAHPRGRRRVAPRRRRNPLADEHSAAARRAPSPPDPGRRRAGRGRAAVRGSARRRSRGVARRSRRAGGSEVQGCRSHRATLAHRHREEGSRGGKGGVEASREQGGPADPHRRSGGEGPPGGALGRRPALAVTGRERIVPALAAAAVLARKLDGHVGMLKVGLELFVAHGRAAVDAVKTVSLPVFLDLKLHDIPNTVEAAARGAATIGAALLTVHATGGSAMIRAARRGLEAGAKGPLPPKLLAVTILTSLGEDDLGALGISGSPADAALRLARLALEAGADGVVCSPAEVGLLRRELGPKPLL